MGFTEFTLKEMHALQITPATQATGQDILPRRLYGHLLHGHEYLFVVPALFGSMNE